MLLLQVVFLHDAPHLLTSLPPQTEPPQRHPAPAIYHLLRLLAGCPTPSPSSSSSLAAACTTQPPKVVQQLVQALLTTCRESPEALAAVVPNLEVGAVALMKALRRSGGQAAAGRRVGEIPELALPLVLQDTLTVAAQCAEGGGAGGGGEAEDEAAMGEMKAELQRELQTAGLMGERGGSMR